MSMGVAGFPLRGRAEHRGYVILPLNIRLGRKIQITTVRLGFTRERIFQVVVSLGAFQFQLFLLAGVGLHTDLAAGKA